VLEPPFTSQQKINENLTSVIMIGARAARHSGSFGGTHLIPLFQCTLDIWIPDHFSCITKFNSQSLGEQERKQHKEIMKLNHMLLLFTKGDPVDFKFHE